MTLDIKGFFGGNGVLITHANCMDGTGVVMAVSIFKEYIGNKASNMPKVIYAQYNGDDPLEMDIDGKDIMIADFSYNKETLLLMNERVNSMVVLDHHKTAELELAGLEFCKFDMDKSGAVLAYEYLNEHSGNAGKNHPIPEHIKYIQDRDLWKWDLKKSKEINTALRFRSAKLAPLELLNTPIRQLATEGELLLEQSDTYVNSKVNGFERKPEFVYLINDVRVPVLNNSHLISDVGNVLSESYGLSLQYFFTRERIVFSLRSIGDIDVAAIAKLYSGGGHKNAAGFSFKLNEIDLEEFFLNNKIVYSKGFFGKLFKLLGSLFK